MKWSVEHKVLTGFAVAILILAAIGGLAYQSTLQFLEASRLAAKSQQTITALEETFSLLNQAETRQRIYLISGDEHYLAPRHASITRMHVLLDDLRLSMTDSSGRRQLDELEKRIEKRLRLLDAVLKMRREQGFEAARRQLLSGDGEREMNAVHDIVLQMGDEERERLREQEDASHKISDRMLAIFFVALVSVALFFGVLFLLISREMRERKQAEEELASQTRQLRENEARLRAIVDTAVEGIIVIDEKGIIERFNPAAERIFGYSANEVLNRNISMLMPSPYREEHDAYIGKYLATGKKKIIGIGREAVGQHKNGTVFPVELAVAEMRVNDRRLFTGVIRDISERKQAEEKQSRLIRELESANEELKNFAYVVSHDLKAPLRAIGSLADWIASDYADKFDDEGREHMRLLTGRVRRMDALIDGILQYSRVGRVREALVPVNTRELAHEVLDSLAPPPDTEVVIDDSLPTVMAERTRIQQVLQNLLSNAVKHLDKPSGKIQISCAREGGFWHFSVSDNGPGIEARHFEKIFQLFQTLAPRDKVENTGVGLTLVKKIVEMYGGKVWVESTLGTGSTFHFTWPAHIQTNTNGETA